MNYKITNDLDEKFTIDIDGNIGCIDENSYSFQDFKKDLIEISNAQNPEILVNIRSSGGDVNDALLIYDALVQIPDAQITTMCYGYTASAATIIAQAASKSHRKISANALYLIHKSSTTQSGNSTELSRLIDVLDLTDEKIAAIYAGASGRTSESFLELMSQDDGESRWLTPEEALEVGLVDEIVTTNSTSQSKFMNMSKKWLEVLNLLGIMQPKNDDATKEHHIEAVASEITNLQTKISSLEVENLRLNALATPTLQGEDPSMKEHELSQNQKAYGADLMNFKK